jgi:hypothetical protein
MIRKSINSLGFPLKDTTLEPLISYLYHCKVKQAPVAISIHEAHGFRIR